jgi:hypothetical protein
MKYLKYFESSEELTEEKIKEMFLDISDMDWNVQVLKTEELMQKGDNNYNNFEFEFVNFFRVRIFKIHTSRRWDVEQKKEIENLLNSDIYKEVIEVANERLNDFGWYIDMKTLSTEFSKITFNIYKYEDKEV